MLTRAPSRTLFRSAQRRLPRPHSLLSLRTPPPPSVTRHVSSQAAEATEAAASTSHASSNPVPEPPDHRKLGTQLELFATSPYSPGSPIFLPAGARVFNRLFNFLRAQYVRHGFDEVITPNVFKTSLWERSGHLQNYAENMYGVVEGVGAALSAPNPAGSDAESSKDGDQLALKPMSCPAHCLIFASKSRSYRDLPIRLADFSALHRNEIAGALSGLTRVRRFHQDDGHIFCRPSQVRAEISRELAFVRDVYGVLGLNYRLALSTRPGDGKMLGSAEDWDRAEGALREALDGSGAQWSVREGDGAFYGPKIDVVVCDKTGKEHQTATIQLDFQLPKRFELEYKAPAAELEARGEEAAATPEQLAEYGPVMPVLVHRAVLGSVERMMALLIEESGGQLPLWLNPWQAMVVTVNTDANVVDYAWKVRDELVGCSRIEPGRNDDIKLEAVTPTGLTVEVDDTARPMGVKLREARAKNFGRIVIVGKREVETGSVQCSGSNWRPSDLRDDLLQTIRRFE